MKYSVIKEGWIEDKELNEFLKSKIQVRKMYDKHKDEEFKELLDMFKEKYIEICGQIRSILKIKNAIGLAPSKKTNHVYIYMFDYELKDGERICVNVTQDKNDKNLYIEI